MNDAVAVSGEPDVALVIDVAAMCTMRQVSRIPVSGTSLDQAGVPPPGDHIAVGVECDDRGKGDRTACGGVVPGYGAPLISLKHTIYGDADFPSAVESINVVTLVDAVPGDLALHPDMGLTVLTDRSRQR